MNLSDAVAIYAALVSTVVGGVQIFSWLRSRKELLLSVIARKNAENSNRVSHIEVDVQSLRHPLEVRAIYLAGYSSRWHWLLSLRPNETLGNEWAKLFPKAVAPGHGWQGLYPVGAPEQALAARNRHVRITVRHTSSGRTVSSNVTKLLRK